MAFAALGVIAVIYTAMRLLGIGPVGTLVASGRLSEKDRLVVADFENRTADPNLADRSPRHSDRPGQSPSSRS
jgi:hypothetical protein